MKFQFEEQPEPRVELTPLIDVIFQLLLFFMVTTTFAAGPDKPGLDVDLPSSGAPKRISRDTDLVVVLTADGQILVGDQLLGGTEELEARFRQAKSKDKNAKVVLQADKRSVHENVVQILDAARGAGLRIAIATDVKSRS